MPMSRPYLSSSSGLRLSSSRRSRISSSSPSVLDLRLRPLQHPNKKSTTLVYQFIYINMLCLNNYTRRVKHVYRLILLAISIRINDRFARARETCKFPAAAGHSLSRVAAATHPISEINRRRRDAEISCPRIYINHVLRTVYTCTYSYNFPFTLRACL